MHSSRSALCMAIGKYATEMLKIGLFVNKQQVPSPCSNWLIDCHHPREHFLNKHNNNNNKHDKLLRWKSITTAERHAIDDQNGRLLIICISCFHLKTSNQLWSQLWNEQEMTIFMISLPVFNCSIPEASKIWPVVSQKMMAVNQVVKFSRVISSAFLASIVAHMPTEREKKKQVN